MMNYVGSISILDRGEIHAQAIIDKNARSLAQRIADETKDELDKVMTRVENIYVSYEQSTQDMFSTHSTNVEYIEDIKELEEILTDQIKKKKYQQQVTVFIVGFENLSNQRLKLIQQVNEFFMDATRPPDEEEVAAPSPDIDLEEVSHSIEESLNSAEELADRLGELNKEMVDWLTNYAINKASSKGKKKLEKALSQAKDDLGALGDKLVKVQTEMEEKEDKVQQMLKQLESKTQDVQKFRTAAEVAKKSLQDLEAAQNKSAAEIQVKDQILKDLRSKVQMLELEVGQSQYVTKMSSERLVEGKMEIQKRMEDLQNQVEGNKSQLFEAQRDWQKLHDQQILALTTAHKQEMEDLKAAYEEQMKLSKTEVEETKLRIQEAEKIVSLAQEEADKARQDLIELQLRGSSAESKLRLETELDDELQSQEESRPSTKASKQSTPGQKQRSSTLQNKSAAKSIVINQSPGKVQKETSDASVQDEGGDPASAHVETRQSKRARSTLQTVQEADVNFDDIFDIKDNQSWATVPVDQVPGRFVQYRNLTQKTLEELEEKLHITVTKTQRKVQTLKSQFQEHKGKWEAERKVLIEQVEQAQKLQNEAEKEADNAMTQLEEFINEQERLEEEEEEKRNDITKGISRPATVRSTSEKKPPSASTEVKVVSPEPVTAEGSEQELNRLMQQTDDAKSERQRTGSVMSSADIDQDIAPWLLSSHPKSQRASSTSASEDDVEEPKRKSLSSKSTHRSRSDRIQSNLSLHGDPIEVDEEEVEGFESEENVKSQPLSSRSRKTKSRSQRSMSRSETQRSIQENSEIDGAPTSMSINSSASRSKSQDQEASHKGSRMSSRQRSGSQPEVLVEDFAHKNGPVSRRSSRDQIEGEDYEKSRTGTMSHKSSHHVISEESQESRGVVSRRSSMDNRSQDRRSSLDQSVHSRKSKRRSSLQDQLSRRSTRQQSMHQSTDSRTSQHSAQEGQLLESSKGMIDSRMTLDHDELINLEEADYSDDDFEDDEVDHDQFQFDEKLASRSRSQPMINVRTPGSQAVNGKPGRDSAPGQLQVGRDSKEGHVRGDRSRSLTSAQAQEMARLTSGAMSAPPAVEPEEEAKGPEIRKHKVKVDQKLSPTSTPKSPRPHGIGQGNLKSRHQRLADTNRAIEEISETGSKSAKSQSSSQREAWLTPRVTPAQGQVMLTPQQDDDRVLPPSQESAVHNIKSMMEEENLSGMQYRTLESVRSALQQLNEGPLLTDVQLERTLTIISLASQMTEESLQLGVLPDSLFDQLAEINSRAMSEISHGEDDYRIDETPLPPVELLRPLTRDSLISRDEPSSMLTFLQDWTFASLRSLPPLQGFINSSQSQRNISRQRSGSSFPGKPPSAPLLKQKSGFEKGQTFATMATRGSTLIEDFSEVSSKQSSKVQFMPYQLMNVSQGGGLSVDAFPGGEDTELDIMLMDTETQTDPEFNTEPSITEEDVRLLSAASRASLRSQFKTKLEETRQAVEDRRSKSPAISVPSQRSLEADQLVDEEDDLPMEDVKEENEDVAEMGTSPPPSKMEKVEHVSSMSRKSISGLQDHPVVKEYLKAYDGVQFFRDSLSKILLDKEMLQAGDIIQDLDMMKFDREGKVQPQLETMTKNIYFVLEEIISILGSIMVEDREPVVSSLTGMLVSRDGTKNTLAGREKSADSGRGQIGTRASNQSITGRMHVASASSEKVALKDLQQQYVILQEQLNEETKKHEEQLRHNTVVMMEMQDTINELQRELTALGRASSRMRPASEAGSQQPESAVMFTRLDSERNAKIMKRAVNDRKLDTEKYKEAVNKMDDYVSLPAQRLGHLVRKYVHHCQMKEIEENVKKSKSLNENVFEILDKMEGLQNQRAKRWADKMDEMGSERIRLANLLMETLDSIEQESGIFLIKPMYSYRGREMRERYGGKLSRPLKPQRNLSPMREVSSYAPAPTPASNARGTLRIHPYSQPQDPNNQQPMYRRDPVRPLEGDDTGLMGSQALAYAGTTQRQTWNLNASMVRGETADQHMNLMNTPRILELDINRMLIGQNTISTKLPSSGISEDRLVNASQNNLRSYVTVNRPSAQPGVGPRPRSFTGTKEVPPSSPNPRSGVSGSAGNKRVRMSDVDQSRSLLSGTPPLPPIAGRGRESPEDIDHPEPPRSPIGSSLRVSPPHIQEVISPLK